MEYAAPVPGSPIMRPRVVVIVLLLAGLVAFWWTRGGEQEETTSGEDTERDESAAMLPAHLLPSGESRAIPRWFGQPGSPARRIAGRVVYNGAPVEGAEVRLSSVLFSAGFAPEPRIQTDASGRFDFGQLPAATYRVTATAPDRTPFGRSVDLRDPRERPAPDQLELRLRDCQARLVGMVEDASGGPIAGAAVRVSGFDSLTMASSDDDGTFEFCVPAGNSTAIVRADGYGTLVRSLYVEGRTPATFELTPAVTVTGRVERDGEPVAQAQVVARSDLYRNPATRHEQTMTDDSGVFTFETLSAGRYTLTATAESGKSDPTQIVLRTGDIAPEVVLTLEPTASIRGVVKTDGVPVPGVQILASPPSRAMVWFSDSAEAVSRDDGTFVIAGLRPGEFALQSSSHEIITPKRVQLSASASSPPDGKNGDEKAGQTAGTLADTFIEVEVAALATIRGRVLRNGQPVADALVSAQGSRTTSDGAGAFTLSGLEAGKHQLYAESLRVGAFTRAVEVEVDKGATVEGIELVLDLEASIAGRVIDEQGQPVAGAYLSFSLTQGNDYGRATTGSDGGFVATAMSGGGDYEVTIQRSAATAMPLLPAQGDRFPPVPVDGRDSQVTGIEFVVKRPSHSVVGRVQRDSGAPVADALIQIISESSRYGGSSPPSVMSDVDGNFELREVSSGDYRVIASVGDGTRTRDQKVTVPGEPVVVVLPDTGSVEGELVGFTQPVEVTLLRKESYQEYSVRSARGRFRFDAVAVGEYTVTATGASEGDVGEFTVTADQVALVTLENRGSGEIHGRLIDFDSGQAVAGYGCSWSKTGSPWSGFASTTQLAEPDASGRFTLKAPAGELTIQCWNTSRRRRTGNTWITRPRVVLEPGATISVTLHAITSTSRLHPVNPGFHLNSEGKPMVQYVLEDSPAGRAGLQAGDMIVAVNGADVTMLEGRMIRYLLTRHMDSTVPITFERDGERHTIEIEIARRQGRPGR